MQWRVREVLCRAGPTTPRFEERHAWTGVAVVAAGSFSYRGDRGHAQLVPGSLLLANHGACFECGHAHGIGDRCIAFQYAPELAETAFSASPRFALHRIPPIEATLPLTTAAVSAVHDAAGWEELALCLLDSAVRLACGGDQRGPTAARAHPASTRLARALSADPRRRWTLSMMAEACGIDRFTLIRAFRRQFGITPYRYLLRERIALAARSLRSGRDSVQSIALDCGFEDLSEFNRRFRRLFGMTPSMYRRRI